MTYVRPTFRHPDLPKNKINFTKKDYEGALSTLCAGCGHDSISGAIAQACFELSVEPHRIAKLSGIFLLLNKNDIFIFYFIITGILI